MKLQRWCTKTMTLAQLWVMHRNLHLAQDTWVLNIFVVQLGQEGFNASWTCGHKIEYGQYVYQQFTVTDVLSTCRLFVGPCPSSILPGILLPCGHILLCGYQQRHLCTYIIYGANHSCGCENMRTDVPRLCRHPLGHCSMVWLVQSTITLQIVGGCYHIYVDKIDSNTILLLSLIPCHWIGTMGHCHLLVVTACLLCCCCCRCHPHLPRRFELIIVCARHLQCPPCHCCCCHCQETQQEIQLIHIL